MSISNQQDGSKLCSSVDHPTEDDFEADRSLFQEQLEDGLPTDIRKMTADIQRHIRQHRVDMEKKIFDKFYSMRIEQSRKSIELVRKINKSRDDFINYLKNIGSQGLYGDGDGDPYGTSPAGSTEITSVSRTQ